MQLWRELPGWIANPYSTNRDPLPRTFRAEVRWITDPNDVAGRAGPLTVDVDAAHFGVVLAFADPAADGTRWTATATSTRSVSSTGFALTIRDANGATLESCRYGTTCSAGVGFGLYQASVEDASGNVFGRSAWWSVAESGVQQETIDDLDLGALASLFTGPGAVCTALLHYPGTHTSGSSLSDQYLACETAVRQGGTTLGVLRVVAAAGGGTTVLWYLSEQTTSERAGTDPPDDEPPKPVPPLTWPSDLDQDVERLMQQNPQLESASSARAILKQCRRYASRADASKERCLELPIFASGDLDVPKPTEHDRAAVLERPVWAALNYEDPKQKGDRVWYASDPACEGRSSEWPCHEYPFFSTLQGGGAAEPRPWLQKLNGTRNRQQGGQLSGFYTKCGLRTTGRAFLSVPLPRGSNLPTQKLCNGAS